MEPLNVDVPNPLFYKQLTEEFGFNQDMAKKALLATKNASIDAAIDWINIHQNESNMNVDTTPIIASNQIGVLDKKEEAPKQEPTVMPNPTIIPQAPIQNQPKEEMKEPEKKRTKEEIAMQVKALQEKIRREREEREKLEAREKEQARIKSTKEIQENKEKFDQLKIKREMELRKKEKMDDELAKKRMLETLERDKIARFGDKYIKKEELKKEEKQGKPGIEIGYASAKKYVDKIIEMYDERNIPGIASGCLEFLCKYLGNLASDPKNEKFQKINSENKIFKEKIASLSNGCNVLIALGYKFDPVSKMLVYSVPYKEEDIKEIIKYMQDMLQLIVPQ